MTQQIYPLLFTPIYKNYVWGGQKIARIFNRKTDVETCAESWEIADRPEGASVVANGPFAGSSLSDLRKRIGPSALFGNYTHSDKFPILIKIIDAKQQLSVQVHPDNLSAPACGGEPKTEMWYVLEAEPNAIVLAGFKKNISEQSFKQLLEEKHPEDTLQRISVQTDQAIYIPGGRIHSIGAGCLMLEIQQNSNTTYRVYDWNRSGTDNKPRELHTEQALKTINWNDTESAVIKPQKLEDLNGNTIWKLTSCDHFEVMRLNISKQITIKDMTSFHALFIAKGKVVVEGNNTAITMEAGTSCLLPAGLKSYSITPASRNAVIIRSSIPASL